MTEAEWLACTDPTPMLAFLRGKASDRKLWLFGCACWRAVWDDKWPRRSRHVVYVAESFADGRATDGDLNLSRYLALQAAQHVEEYPSRNRLFFAADTALRGEPLFINLCNVFQDDEQMRPVGQSLLRDIFGNPFRPVAADPAWLTSTAVSLARIIYEDRAFDRLPILADALEDAGCDNTDLLAHCRGDGPHVRGCWAVDLVLGKE
ncbi:MAG TPA: hypothetical protein VM597_02370 [Gemmataceae bacterium]|nr:hypothetical protein [Gemmataceae bacterium]